MAICFALADMYLYLLIIGGNTRSRCRNSFSKNNGENSILAPGTRPEHGPSRPRQSRERRARSGEMRKQRTERLLHRRRNRLGSKSRLKMTSRRAFTRHVTRKYTFIYVHVHLLYWLILVTDFGCVSGHVFDLRRTAAVDKNETKIENFCTHTEQVRAYPQHSKKLSDDVIQDNPETHSIRIRHTQATSRRVPKDPNDTVDIFFPASLVDNDLQLSNHYCH